MTAQSSGIELEDERLQDEVWGDWSVVGKCFRRLDSLSEMDRQTVARGETLVSRVMIADNLLWGSVFRYEALLSPEALAAVFSDYAGQWRYVPGMPVTKVSRQRGKLHRVFHRSNPVTFIAPQAQSRWPAWLYNRLPYSYELDEEVFPQSSNSGLGYSIRWTIPLETQVLGARENGEICFTPMQGGTLITYNNATEPFGYRKLQGMMPRRLLTRVYRSLGGIASDYYQRTVNNFVDVMSTLAEQEIQTEIMRLRGALEDSGGRG